MGWACGTYGWGEGGVQGLGGETGGKENTGGPWRRCVDNIRMDLQEVGIWTGLGWPGIGADGGRL